MTFLATEDITTLSAETVPDHITSVLEINTKEIIKNYYFLNEMLSTGKCGAVVKADAYGLGAEKVGAALERVGCQEFFVAHVEEGIALRKALPQGNIYVFTGLLPGTADCFIEHNLIPVLNNIEQIKTWYELCRKEENAKDAAIHFDTGMLRNGLDKKDQKLLLNNLQWLAAMNIHFYMTHLACSTVKDHPLNDVQLGRLKGIVSQLPTAPISLADSGGIFIGPEYHFDLVRPGFALFGMNPTHHGMDKNPMTPCVRFRGRIIQVKEGEVGDSVGYGATHVLDRPSRLAVVGAGYSNGYLRSLSNQGVCFLENWKVPVLGRVSMDYIVVDVTDVPESVVAEGRWIDLVNAGMSLDHLGALAQTISREMLTGIGKGTHRVYV
ncbi:MAG: alanine racemase [Alphaproteobacteria bacterium]|jgi:alanine racemase|nr:alanine racemase [Alphaproteobacteria bacterium]MBT5389355.1 alanine racemase [Alphaproteobacteria bacterium]MBT5541027.1 alanine racemase [Alphaproteobacteria bacterium]MBT5654589.1 alanine racemase [Alphaproteobacteria bacterium]